MNKISVSAYNNSKNKMKGDNMKKPEKKAHGTHGEFPLRDEMTLTGTVSASDCTGMVPSGSIDSAEEFDTANRLRKFSEGKGRS